MPRTATDLSPSETIDALAPERIAANFPRTEVPGTGRTAFQITSGPDFCQALYYFIPSMSADGHWLVYQRYQVVEDVIQEVSWEALDMLTGERRQLASVATTPDFLTPGEPTVFNAAREEFIYSTGSAYRAVAIDTGDDRLLFEIPSDRAIKCQNCVSPCGRYFFYISQDAAQIERIKDGRSARREISDTQLVRYDLDTGEHHLVVRINAFTKHVIPYGDRHLVFSYDHLPTEHMLLMTDYEGGWYAALRTPNQPGVQTCHYGATRRGVQYEASGGGQAYGGMTCPRTHRRVEFTVPNMPGRHVAAVPAGDRWMTDGVAEGGRVLYTLSELSDGAEPSWQLLSGPWPTYGTGQKSHGHPYVTPCGRWVLLLAGDPATQTNHLYLMDVSDVPPTRGLPDYAADAEMPFPV
ncbi:MAG: hypothetical protein PF961_05695 [Planctomycetota bacterium]|jgi:hypothetical protein|nr:hypothetical protein [Planctomycetota bacterium]